MTLQEELPFPSVKTTALEVYKLFSIFISQLHPALILITVRAFGIIGGGATLAFAGAITGIQLLGPAAIGLGTIGNV